MTTQKPQDSMDPANAAMPIPDFKEAVKSRLGGLCAKRQTFIQWVTKNFPEPVALEILEQSALVDTQAKECIDFLWSRVAYEWLREKEEALIAAGKIVVL